MKPVSDSRGTDLPSWAGFEPVLLRLGDRRGRVAPSVRSAAAADLHLAASFSCCAPGLPSTRRCRPARRAPHTDPQAVCVGRKPQEEIR